MNIETKEITINEDEASIVRYMFERYVERIGSSTIYCYVKSILGCFFYVRVVENYNKM